MTATSSPVPVAPLAADRSSAIRRALLFLLLCSPIWLVPGALGVGHPAVMDALIVGVTWLFLRHEGRALSVLGLDPSWRRVRELAVGFAGGALLILVMAALVRLALPIPWAWNRDFALDMALYSLLWLLCGNAVEELVFRGYAFDRLITGLGLWPAQVAVALLFALFHLANGWSWQAALFGTTVGSVLYGLVFVRWRSVPAAAGVHAATNWVRDLLLTDPPVVKTLLAPLAPRPWTSGERLAAFVIMDGVFLLASVALAISIRRRRTSALASIRT